MLRTFELDKRELNDADPWAPFLSATAWAIRSTYHTSLDATPGELVFGYLLDLWLIGQPFDSGTKDLLNKRITAKT